MRCPSADIVTTLSDVWDELSVEGGPFEIVAKIDIPTNAEILIDSGSSFVAFDEPTMISNHPDEGRQVCFYLH